MEYIPFLDRIWAAMETPITDAAVESIADAIFNEELAAVVEAYSAFDHEPIVLHSAQELCTYARAKRRSDGYIHVAVWYPDMGGRLTSARIALDPSKCDGHTHRHKAQGWGLIWVYLMLSPAGGLGSHISANSGKRAAAWAPTYPDMESPSTWHWPSVARHLRRLRRALKLAA
jgi:hypothetical protein